MEQTERQAEAAANIKPGCTEVVCSVETFTAVRQTSETITPPLLLFFIFLHCIVSRRPNMGGRQRCIRPAAPRGCQATLDILANDVSVAVWRQIGPSQFVGTRRTAALRRCGGEGADRVVPLFGLISSSYVETDFIYSSKGNFETNW